MATIPYVPVRRKVKSPVTIYHPLDEWATYLERRGVLTPAEIDAFRAMTSEVKQRAEKLAEHWYERGKGEQALFSAET